MARSGLAMSGDPVVDHAAIERLGRIGGVDLVRRMLAEAADHLTEQGTLVIEVGNSQVHVEALYPEVDFTWLEFEQGGHGVFLLTAQQCRQHQKLFQQRLKKL